MNQKIDTHPKGTRARVLLSSVFGPFAQDDDFGSRKINPMELYHNQVTRIQGGFSLRMFHRSFGLMLIQANLDAPCTLLDFPDLDRFVEEITTNSYDIVGISGIIPNIGKIEKMCELIRIHLPNAAIVIGGHVANLENLKTRVNADHVVKGEGVQWFRQYLGQDTNAPIAPVISTSGFSAHIMGHNLSDKPENTAAILIPSVGCPLGCNFCSTSALFGGKGKFVNFYETGAELFKAMCDIEEKLKVKSFFILDENFLLHRKRALELLDLMDHHKKSWAIMVFSSARVIRSYSIEQLVRLGICWVWMGLEGEKSQYRKLKGIDTKELVTDLQSHGIRVLGSTIIGLEHHSPDNISDVIDYAISHNTDFHQFMLYTPVPGTPLHKKLEKEKILYSESEFSLADSHGQYRFNFRHDKIKDGHEEKMLINAFEKDFTENGPSLARLIRTMLTGWKRYKNHIDPCIRKRYRWDTAPIRTTYAGAVWAMRKWYGKNTETGKIMDTLLKDLYQEFGIKTRLIAPVIGLYVHNELSKQEKLLAEGRTYEPKIFYEKNPAALSLEQKPKFVVETGLEGANIRLAGSSV